MPHNARVRDQRRSARQRARGQARGRHTAGGAPSARCGAGPSVHMAPASTRAWARARKISSSLAPAAREPRPLRRLRARTHTGRDPCPCPLGRGHGYPCQPHIAFNGLSPLLARSGGGRRGARAPGSRRGSPVSIAPAVISARISAVSLHPGMVLTAGADPTLASRRMRSGFYEDEHTRSHEPQTLQHHCLKSAHSSPQR